MVEKVVAALRRSAIAVLKNLWLLIFEVLYGLSGPLLILGGTGVTLLLWWLTHGTPDFGMLFRDPLQFLLYNWSILLYAFFGWMVGATFYLLLFLFYNAALTGVIGRSVGLFADSAAPVETSVFWESGSCGFGRSMGIAGITSMLIVPPLIPMLVLLIILAFRLPQIIMVTRPEMLGIILRYGIPLALSGLLFAILSWLAVVWYRYALCYAVVRGESTGNSVRSSLRFFRRHWKPVLGLAVGSMVVSLAISLLFAQAGFISEHLKSILGVFMVPVVLLSMPVGWVVGIFLNIWLRAAVIVLFMDCDAPAKQPVDRQEAAKS